MNIKTIKVVVLLLAVFGFNSAYATQASMTTSFNTALNNVVGDSSNLFQTTINGNNAWKFYYNDSNSEFSAFGDTDEDASGYISLAKHEEVVAFGYQCVGFIKATTNLASTSTTQWIEGTAITPYNLPSRGDVIAIFDSNGDYDYSGHVAIVLSANSSYIYVIDQNWEGTGEDPVGRVIIHTIPFDGTGNNDADNYSIVEF